MMPTRSKEDVLKQVAADLRNIDLENALVLQNFLQKYVGPPGVADESDRSSIREDSVIQAVRELLDDNPGKTIRLLDACCGNASLATHLLNGLGKEGAKRVEYLGIDQSSNSIAKARKLEQVHDHLAQFDCRIIGVWHLPTEWHNTIDIVVLNNTLHELPPHRFPELLEGLNKLLTSDLGRVCIFDMEKLPDEEPESIAINWNRTEVENFLRAAGFEVAPTGHEKGVPVFRAQVKRAKAVLNHRAMLVMIESLLQRKMETAIAHRQRLEPVPGAGTDFLMAWIVMTGTIARHPEELRAIQNALAKLPPESQVQHASDVRAAPR